MIEASQRRRLRRWAILAAGWFVMTSGVFSGCRGLFTPAIPEAPAAGPPLIPHYESLDATLATMSQALSAKGQGASLWLGAFDATGYHQEFDDRDLSTFRSGCQCHGPDDWVFSQEQVFYQAFIEVRPTDEYVVSFTPVDWNPDPTATSSTEAFVHRHYQVNANAPDGNSTLIIAIGTADLTFKVTDGKWLITHWADRVDSTVGVVPNDPYQISLGRRRLESTQ